jgi:hypothetical protein
VFGAQAVVIYGQPRLTADLDITLEIPLSAVVDLLPELEAHGFESRAGDPADLVRRTRVLPLVHQSTGLAVDVVIAGPGLEEEFLANRHNVDLAGLEVPVISPEDLLVTKILSGRPKDVDDALGVLREQGGSLDLERTRRFLGLLEQALGRTDLLPDLDRLLDRAIFGSHRAW